MIDTNDNTISSGLEISLGFDADQKPVAKIVLSPSRDLDDTTRRSPDYKHPAPAPEAPRVRSYEF